MCVRRRVEEQWISFIYVKTYYLIWGFNPGGGGRKFWIPKWGVSGLIYPFAQLLFFAPSCTQK
jgi:hypothetical protein